jgi:hypothetical protein
MTRFQCPHCEGIHRSEDTEPCSTHTLGYSPRCPGCVQAAQAIKALCGGGQS